jgi:hypothetical protein
MKLIEIGTLHSQERLCECAHHVDTTRSDSSLETNYPAV